MTDAALPPPDAFPPPAAPSPRPAQVDADTTGPEAPLVDPAQLPQWIIFQDERVLVVNKPGWLVVHPSKRGPWSSLVGACREYLGLDQLHLANRLDRETSGLVVLAKDAGMAKIVQGAFEWRQVDKTYLGILEGTLEREVYLRDPIGPDPDSPVSVRQKVGEGRGAQKADTRLKPIATGGGYTLVEAFPGTGRKHQIRVHAAFAGHPVVGDKLYGPDPLLYLEFAHHGWTPRHAALLPLSRQALHCARLRFKAMDFRAQYFAPLPDDLRQFARERMGLGDDVLAPWLNPAG